ncbi:restriction endonuclease subunit S [Ligilactobacillus agilis]|uniref:restriction endonuclease subunit S n=1 Tax=Ligilactobacillus agilis TaxID=1601 RepID=UPI00254CF804|nr:restriction endonuclease subunit S [Ligilactobacillus agilis]MDK6808850.1 restriction endonuclease subunit S [Ligilactobacillus agilis]
MTSKKVMLKQIGKIVTGKTPATDNLNFWDGEILFISPTDLHVNMWVKDTQRKITERGLNSIRANAISGLSILVGCIGWDMENVAIVNGVCATNQQINSITEIKTELVNPYYVYYWLKNKKDYLFKISNVTRTPVLKKFV